jgi:putative flavoprotein involved in K+ transport
MREERHHTVVIGGGQAGLSVGYQLRRRGLDFVILDAGRRVGDGWRNRWDSLRLFTPARYDGLAGMPFPAPPYTFPTKDEMADYLETYARQFQLPVRLGVRVDALSRRGERFLVTAGGQRYEADNVVVAMSSYQAPVVPPFAGQLRPDIVQLHANDYRNPSQLRPGGVLLVGAGNSGADIAMEVVKRHPTWLSGRQLGHVPFRIEGLAARLVLPFLFRVVFHRLLTVRTPVGRKARPGRLTGGKPLIRVKPRDLVRAGVQRVPKTVGVKDGKPELADGRVLDVANVIWCTGFRSGFSWIKLPVLGPVEPMHDAGLVASEPGLYFVGLEFLYSASSEMIHGLERDADRIAQAIAARGRGIPADRPAAIAAA